MIEMKKITDKVEIIRLCAEYQKEYSFLPDCFALYEQSSLLGCCFFCEEKAEIFDFCAKNANDFSFIGINLCRAVLNFLDLQGKSEAFCFNLFYEELLLKVGFKKVETYYKVDLKDFFAQKCKNI
jgi:hypothetical protein